MLFLAHRGLWVEPNERNSRSALQAAFAHGFGAETDIRDYDGRLVISHDMATEHSIRLTDMLADYDAAGRPGVLALNIKSDGLTASLERELAVFEGMQEHVFVFDMSVPDTLHYLKSSIPVFTRFSEYEPVPPLETCSQGLWMDCFVDNWVDPEEVLRRLRKGQRLAVVSPELHKRNIYEEYWYMLRESLENSGIPSAVINRNMMLCTDYPREASEFFGDIR